MNCPTCNEVLSERGSYCKFCGSQARCLQCKEILEPAAKACVECGTMIGQGKAVEGINGAVNGAVHTAQELPANRNTITYWEDRNSRDFQASLTDSSMQSVGTVFAEVFAQRGIGRVTQHGPHGPSKEAPVLGDIKAIAAPEAEVVLTSPEPEAAPANTELKRISEIFRPNGEALELVENRLKAKSGMDYVRRLTYLFLYAHELHGRDWTPKADLLTVLREAKVLDANSRNWLNHKKGFRADAEDRLQLIQVGREEAKKALAEALDSNVTDDWNPDKKVPVKRGPRKKKE